MENSITIERAIGVLLAGLLAVWGVSSCSVNPATGERQLALISESQEVELGRNAAEQAEQTLGLVDDAELQKYVADIGLRLAAASERPELPWRFGVIDDPVPNAFALPGGFIYVTRGMTNLMNSEAELASVLGHEIAHVTARHSVSQISRAQLAQLGLGLGAILYPEYRSLTNIAATGTQLLMLKYGRDAERQADELGFSYALEQDYDMNEMADVFLALQRSGDLAGRSALPGWLSTHPGSDERIEAVRQRIAGLPPGAAGGRVGRDEYLDAIDGIVYGDNPRHGYFRNGVFYHPDMKFQFSVPDAWQTRNTSSAVIAISDKQDAKLQFTLASGSALDATNEFLAQQGVQPGGTSREVLNEVPAVIARFTAATEQGNVRGYVASYEYDNRTFQLVLYTPEARFPQYDSEFRGIVSSFAPVDDVAVLNVQPMRMSIITLDRDMSIREFSARYPSPVELDKLALINGVSDANTVFARGSKLKRITGESF